MRRASFASFAFDSANLPAFLLITDCIDQEIPQCKHFYITWHSVFQTITIIPSSPDMHVHTTKAMTEETNKPHVL